MIPGLRRLDDDPAATATDQIASPRDREFALFDEWPERRSDQVGVLVILLHDGLSPKPLGERLLADLVADGLAQRVQLAKLPLDRAAAAATGGEKVENIGSPARGP